MPYKRLQRQRGYWNRKLLEKRELNRDLSAHALRYNPFFYLEGLSPKVFKYSAIVADM